MQEADLQIIIQDFHSLPPPNRREQKKENDIISLPLWIVNDIN